MGNVAQGQKPGQKITFLHIADCHLGSWRDAKLRELGFESFSIAMNDAIARNVDFVLISGDLFNTALPAIDILKQTVTLFRKVHQHKIPIYFIAGSHDYSPAGKTMLHIIEEAGLAKNVMQGNVVDGKLVLAPTIDAKTGVSLCGILGRAQSLDQQYYEMLDRESLHAIPHPKIFLFHCALSEIKPKSMADTPSAALSFLPKGFDYYAGGHVHYRFNQDIPSYGRLVYPGPTFPNNFAEIEELGGGSYVVGTLDGTQVRAEHIFIQSPKPEMISLNCDGLDPLQVNEALGKVISSDIVGKIVMLRMKGTVKGSLTDVKLSESVDAMLAKGAYAVLKNTAALESERFKRQTPTITSAANVEDDVLAQSVDAKDIAASKALMQTLHTQKFDGETKDDFERRVTESVFTILNIKKE
ncbi:MAG TPA: exonuclease SbcCD subunit D [Acidobacteriota bacterium]|nr:exonuclease SbcCD subunit D [Acidobacteriota bacterium]